MGKGIDHPHVNNELKCSDPMELAYYRMDKATNPRVCARCGMNENKLVAGDASQQAEKKFQSLLPLCQDCFVDGMLHNLFSFQFVCCVLIDVLLLSL